MYTKEKIRKRSKTRRNESTDNNNNTLLFLLIYMVFSVVITHASSFFLSLSLFVSLSLSLDCLVSLPFFSFLLRRSARQQFLFLNINDDADDTYLFSNCHPVPKLVVFRRVINLRAKN